MRALAGRIYRAAMTISTKVRSGVIAAILRMGGCEVGRGCVFYGIPRVYRHRGSRIVLGDRVILSSDRRSNPLTQGIPTVLATFMPDAEIIVAEGAGLSGCVIGAVSSVRVGANTLIGAGARIVDSDFHPVCWRCRDMKQGFGAVSAVAIDGDCFVGMGATVLKGAHVRAGSVVAAGSIVVTGAYPVGAVLAGVPAKVSGTALCEEHVAKGSDRRVVE